MAYRSPLILPEGYLKIHHGLHLVSFDKPNIREFLSHPATDTTYTVHRNGDRAPYVNLLPTTSPDGHRTLTLGHPEEPGLVFVRALVDNCSSVVVLSQYDSALTSSHDPSTTRPVVTATGTGASLSSATLDIVLGRGAPASSFHIGSPPTAPATPRAQSPATRRPRTTFGAITDANTAALRFGITSDAQLQLISDNLRGIDIGRRPTVNGIAACNALRAAAARRPVRKTRVATLHIGVDGAQPQPAPPVTPCTEWDFDWSAPFLPDAQDNCFLAKFILPAHRPPVPFRTPH